MPAGRFTGVYADVIFGSVKHRLWAYLFCVPLAVSGCRETADSQPLADAPAMVQLQGVRLERYRDGCPVLSARAERLLIEDLTGRWLADGVQVHIQPEGR